MEWVGLNEAMISASAHRRDLSSRLPHFLNQTIYWGIIAVLILTCAAIGQFQQLDSVSTKALNTKWFICCFCSCESCVFVSLFRLRLLFSNHSVVPVFTVYEQSRFSGLIAADDVHLFGKKTSYFLLKSRSVRFYIEKENCGFIYSEEKLKLLTLETA